MVFDYTYDGIMRAYEQSQLRLGLARYDLAVIHDLDHMYHGTGVKFEGFLTQLATSGWRAITELKASGLIRGIGAGINELGMIPRFLDIVDLDFFLVAMPYTLLRPGGAGRGVPGVRRAGHRIRHRRPIPVGDPRHWPTSGRAMPTTAPPIRGGQRSGRARSRRSASATGCRSRRRPSSSRWAIRASRRSSRAPGRRPQVQRNLEVFRMTVPGAMWDELKHEGLLRQDAPVPA